MTEQPEGREELATELVQLRQQVAELKHALALEGGRQGRNEWHDRVAAMFRAIYDQSRELGAIIDLDGTVRHVNRAACQLLNKNPSELVGKLFCEIPWGPHARSRREELREGLHRASQGETVQFVTAHSAVDGTLHHLDFTLRPARNEDGRIFCLVAEARDATERIRAEEKLRASDTFLQTIIEHSPFSIAVFDHRGTLVRMNQACRDLLHAGDEELIGIYNVFADGIVQRQGMMPLVMRAFERGERVRFNLHYDTAELHLRLRETTRTVLEVTISPVVDARGQVTHAIIHHQDLTERTEAEAALRRNAREMEWLMKSMANAFVVWEPILDESRQLVDIRFVYFNDAYARVSGLKLEQVRGKTVREVWPETEQSWFDTYGEVALTGQPKSFEMYHKPTRGLYACNAYRPWDAPPRICVVFEDVTERRQAEAALRASEERFKRLLQNSNDIITVMDEEGLLLSIHGPVETVLGYRAEELIGTSGFDFVHPDDLGPTTKAFAELLLRPGSTRRAQHRCRRRNGDWVVLETVGTNLLHDPLVKGVVANIRDISEREKAEQERNKLQEQLQQAMKMEAVGRLAGGVAHDFNNLLTVILAGADLARMNLTPDDPLLHSLDQIHKAADSAAALTRQLLAFSRRQVIEPKVLNLNDLVNSLHSMLARLIGEDVELQTIPGADLGSVKVDPGQFEQVLVNLVVNARDAMPEGGRLLIETANVVLDKNYCAGHPSLQPGEFVLLAVSDTGHGMDEEVKKHLFEPFFTTKSKERGTGLGLATIFGAVQQADGAIEVYSEVGRGTTFKIYLPRSDEQAGKLLGDAAEPDLARGSETILLVEDEASVRDMTVIILKRLGYQVLPAANGGEALLLVEKHGEPIDLLMTDVVMPGMNGRELAERLTQLQPDLRVLFTSGYAENVIVHHGVVEEHLNFIAKPFSLRALARKLREILGGGRGDRNRRQ